MVQLGLYIDGFVCCLNLIFLTLGQIASASTTTTNTDISTRRRIDTTKYDFWVDSISNLKLNLVKTSSGRSTSSTEVHLSSRSQSGKLSISQNCTTSTR